MQKNHFTQISFNIGFALCMMMIFFGTLPELFTQYFYIKFVDPEFLTKQTEAVLEILNEATNTGNHYMDSLKEGLENAPQVTPASLVSQTFWMNIYSGALVSVAVALFTKSKN